jgi:thiamine biosynthesis lipoprotein ApbE
LTHLIWTPRRTPAPSCKLRRQHSGDTIQYFEFGGKRYGHLIDPRTGQAIASRRMCIAIAPNGITSDPPATIGTIMPTAQYETLLEHHFPELRTLLLSAPSGDIQSKPRARAADAWSQKFPRR